MQQKNIHRLQPLSNSPDGPPGSSLQSIKTHQKAREEDEKIRLKRVKGAIVLILQFLLDQGYLGTMQMLQQESRIALHQFCPADNVDLLSIILEYEHYFEFRFNRRPKLFRPIDSRQNELCAETHGGELAAMQKKSKVSSGFQLKQGSANVDAKKVNYFNAAHTSEDISSSNAQGAKRQGILPRPVRAGKTKTTADCGNAFGVDGNFALEGVRLDAALATNGAKCLHGGESENEFFGRALKPLPQHLPVELQELAISIQRDILDVNPNVNWSSIAELDQAKQLLKEAVVMPVKYPELFAGIVRPWKGILLFGPPGTGKTLLAKAVATECRTTFFNISASSVVSKWRGDSEKLVRLLFDLAVHYAPSTIFIDEIDSLMSSRSGDGMHEGSRRMKTELLIQMDGLSKRRGGEVVFVLAASNVPWDLDTAMLRRLEKRILVDLPTHDARAIMFRQVLTSSCPTAPNIDWNMCANLTAGMSGADIDVVCREAMMRPIRLMIEKLEHSDKPEELASEPLQRPTVTIEDVIASIACTQSSVRESDLKKYEEWAHKYSSGVSS